MRYSPPSGQEYLDTETKYINNPNDNITRGSIVPSKAIEDILREIYYVIVASKQTPSDNNLTQLYQAIANRNYMWSDTINYRNTTLVLGSNLRLYLWKAASGPAVYGTDGILVGSKDPTTISSKLYWEEFSVYKDNDVIDLAEAVIALQFRLDNIEPQISETVDVNVQPLIDLHEPLIATSTRFGHMQAGDGIDIIDGKVSVNVHENIIIDNNKLQVNQSLIVPPTATSERAGVISVGTGLTIDDDVMSLTNHANEDGSIIGIGGFQNYGHIKITDDLNAANSTIDGIGVSPYAVHGLYNQLLGILEPVIITTSQSWIAPASAVFEVTVVGGGGNGGSGGSGFGYKYNSDGDIASSACGGGGGGGGGAGETITTTVTLTKGTSINVVIGGSGGGATSFGTHATARGGGNGSGGSQGCATPKGSGFSRTSGYGGAIGITYGSAPTKGGDGAYQVVYYYTCDISTSGGSGGIGGRSIQGTYGHGGNGGAGGRGYPNCNTENWRCGGKGAGAGGAAGTQGVCIIKVKT